MATLVISRADGTTENYPLDSEIMTIGRHPDSTVVLKVLSASSQHAVLRQREDGLFYLQDLGSSNGTRVNGVEVEECVLNDGDQISFGDEAAAFFTVDVSAPAVAAPVATPHFIPAPVVREPQPQPRGATAGVPYAAAAAPRPKSPKVRSYKHVDDSSGCTSIFLVTLLFVASFFLGLTLKHYNKTGHFLLGDIVERMFSGNGKINIQMQENKNHP